ncbi:Oidioi.mRNA.OKI2018_I69.PAR.g10208.t1.cds [Oikopleura dioica]|uniref:Oidioi.mRNA.OKI2018_I69.PAR.g10208.t1.cds n=1 Tax=Oikopleura dioica TaxID=34765 RepID=A0ABN7RPF7_OIKDI|nr:Oidioi.mRNA.OKI2018_I69.PAR.g10208.t1.cds [Oikopleura dioica]
MGCNSSKSANAAVASTTEVKAVQGENGTVVSASKSVTLYVNQLSPFARTAIMVAKTCDVEVNYHEIDLMKGEQNEDWYLKINPNHTVPVLVDGDTVLTETVDISKYLIDNYGKHKEMNPSGEQAEKIKEVVAYAYETLGPIGKKIVLPVLVHGKPEDVPEEDLEAAKVHGYEYFNNILGDNDFLFGTEKPTWADFLVFSLLMQMDVHPLIRKGEHDKLKLWAKRIFALPFFSTVHKAFFAVKSNFTKAEKPTLYINIASPLARAVLCTADELAIDYDTQVLDFMKQEHKAEEYLKINPNGTVPGMKHGEKCIGQSRDIAKYLVETFCPDHSLYAIEKQEEINELLQFDEEKCFQAAIKIVGPLMRGIPIPDENREFVKAAKLEAQEKLGEKQFFGGEKPCIADFFIFNNLIQTVIDPAHDHENPDEDLAVLREFIHRMMAIEHVAKKVGEFKETMAKVAQMMKEKKEAEAASEEAAPEE